MFHFIAMAECISFGLIGILYDMVFGETGTLFGNFLVEMGWKMYMNIHEGKCEACVIIYAGGWNVFTYVVNIVLFFISQINQMAKS